MPIEHMIQPPRRPPRTQIAHLLCGTKGIASHHRRLHRTRRLRPDGFDLIPVIADEVVFTAFRYIRESFRWIEETSKGVIGEPLPAPPAEPEAQGEAA